MNNILIVFYKNGKKHTGWVSTEIYYSELFPIFRDHLVPLSTKNYEALQKDEKEFVKNFEDVQ